MNWNVWSYYTSFKQYIYSLTNTFPKSSQTQYYESQFYFMIGGEINWNVWSYYTSFKQYIYSLTNTSYDTIPLPAIQ